MFWRIFGVRQYQVGTLYNNHFVEVKAYYTGHFNKVPSVTFIGELDITPAFTFLRQHLEQETLSILQHTFYDHAEQKLFFNSSIFVLTQNRMIEVADNYCQLLHTPAQCEWASGLVKELAQFRTQPVEVSTHATVIGFARHNSYN